MSQVPGCCVVTPPAPAPPTCAVCCVGCQQRQRAIEGLRVEQALLLREIERLMVLSNQALADLHWSQEEVARAYAALSS